MFVVNAFRLFCTALSFLTRIPTPFWEKSFADCFAAFPAVGFLIGCVTFATFWTASLFFSPFLGAGIAVAFQVWFTRGLHLDGLADWVDALGGGYTKEKRLEILKDSRVGAFGVMALIVVLGLKTLALCNFAGGGYSAVVVSTVMGRLAMVLCAVNMRSARLEEGLGATFLKGFHRKTAVFAFASTLPLFVIAPVGFAVSLILTLALVVVFRWNFVKKFGGITGDLFGAASEITETAVLILCVGLIRHGIW
ncbi:MAG: adenosylcobinamide-GDP ribazoletransferase [Deltaproteobacteria bacterium]|nr:adenosylcobinamide-GDP ribazoletransferase [Deltaproteobacteria bacterium]MBW2068996.1 adenosylcobinamide-GDP ribazoletransferase [Deltaproteobacteria bacterium]